MTKEKIEIIIKRYKFIKKAIRDHQSEAVFYVGNRKHVIQIAEEVALVFEIIQDVRQNIKLAWVQEMVGGILRGESDVWLIARLPCERSMYYDLKRKFADNVYHCCIAKGMISYEELLKEGIA